MPIRNTTERWGHLSIALHWITVAVILSLVVVGFVMEDLPNTPFKRDVYLLHKSFGLTVLALGVIPAILWWVLKRWPGGKLAAVTNAAEA